MLQHDESADRVSKSTVMSALTDECIARALDDDILRLMIRKEMERGEFDMDAELVDACNQLLWDRHAFLTPKQLEDMKRRSFKRLRRYMKRSAALSQPKRFPLRPIIATVMILFLVASPMLFANQPFRIVTPNHEQQYIVVGIQKNDMGIARAGMNRDTIGTTVELDSLEAIAPHLGYQVELPTWIPAGCTLEKIVLSRDLAFDELFVAYAGAGDKRVSILVTYHETREGRSDSYEQEKRGHQESLQNGATVYVANNINSTWGLYQSPNMDYSIDLTGFDEMTLMKIFNSMRR